MGGRPAQPHRVRGRPRPRHAQLRPRRRVRHLPRLADRLGHPAHPARRDRRGRRRGAARAGPDRHRPARRPGHRQARGVEPTGELAPSRPPRSPTSPRSATTARWSSSTYAAPTSTTTARIDGRGQHPAARARRPARRGARPARSGCTAPAATAPRSPRRCSTPPDAAWSRSTTPSTTPPQVGLHLVGAPTDRVTLRPRRRRRRRAHRAQPGCARRRRLDPRRAGAGLRARAEPRRRRPPARWWSSGVTSLVGAVAAHRAGNVLLARGVAFGVVAIGGAVAGARPRPTSPEPVLLGGVRAC